MKLKITIALLGLINCAFAQDGAPAAPYYNNFNWTQSGTALKNALATKISQTHTNSLEYNEVWDALKKVDQDPAIPSNVLLVYGWEAGVDNDITNDRSRNKNANGGNNGEWNREHVFAQSLGNPVLGQTGPGSDAHHLRASDVQRNNNRGNLKFATGSGNSGASNSGWYPGDEWKGDVARMVMYMYLRYGNQCLPKYVGLGSMASTDNNLPQIFLQWNAEDPVSPFEDARNTYMNSNQTYAQGNRNPFIDNPYLATLIWGGPVAQNRWAIMSTYDYAWTSTVTVYPNPAREVINVTSDVAVDQIDVYNVNGQLIRSYKNPEFVNNTYQFSGLPAGFYIMQVASGNQTVSKKLVVQ